MSPTPPNQGNASGSDAVAKYERLANDMVSVYATGDALAMQRINQHYGRASTVDDLRAIVWRLVYKVRQAKGAAHAFQLPEAQELIARTTGFPNWGALTQSAARGIPSPLPPYLVDAKEDRISLSRQVADREWDTIIAVMKERSLTGLDGNGFLTDDALKRIAELPLVTRLGLGGSRGVSDDGLQLLAQMPQLQRLDLSEYPGGKLTDRGLEVLRHLPNLRSFEMTWQRGISDTGVANLKFCENLERVNLMGSPTGDGAIEALRGKPRLRRFSTGKLVTDAGLPLLHDFPLLKTWQGELPVPGGGEFSGGAHLLIDGPFTNNGLASLAGLAGVWELDLFWHVLGITSAGFAHLLYLPNLGSLGCDGKLSDNEAMGHIAALPRLRNLRAQESIASDEGFVALSKSKSLESLWGRECPNFGSRGFVALSKMPALRGLGIGCRNVDDQALSTLPQFPALRELTPIRVKDAGFRHIGQCQSLERLTCMYCRDTTDAATEHIGGLSNLKYYYAGLTQITDRSLEILSRIASLEVVDLFETKGITDAGLAFLRNLPGLREVNLSGLPNITLAGTKIFPPQVRVNYEV
jgi:hypothetical protein